MGSLPNHRIRRVAVIGAGFAGVAAAKRLAAERCFEKIDVFEQQATVGGVWNYTDIKSQVPVDIPQTNPVQPLDKPLWRKVNDMDPVPIFSTPMYNHLETNLSKRLMQYSDAPFPEEWQLFPTRQQVLKYLDEYAEAENVKPLIRFKTQVIDVRLTNQKSDPDVWAVRWQDLTTSIEASASYDAVAVCSGHFSVPYTPDIKGICAWNDAYPGSLSHSKLYDKPEVYRNKKVIVVGNAASGVDIASQIGMVAQVPLYTSTRSTSMLLSSAAGKEEVPEIAEFISPSEQNRAVRFADGRIERGIDAVLFCTGYLYSFPFLSSLHSQLIGDGFYVQNLYQHFIYIEHPSMAILGMPTRVLPIPLGETQAACMARVWSGRLELPSQETMYEWERDIVARKGLSRLVHKLGYPEDIDYINELYDWASEIDRVAGKMPHRWDGKDRWLRENFPQILKAFKDLGDARCKIRTEEELGFDYAAWLAVEETQESSRVSSEL